MKNAEVKQMSVEDNGALVELLRKARLSEKKDQHLAFSVRLDALTVYILSKSLSVNEIADLLQKEAARFEASAQELI
ncbi:hypothetical protein B4923_15495 [Brenneria roseae subsp. americana]|uniref:DUF2732 domain-containing protein n=1 Tax=Brenneria roseae subsp. americana TaxID=1508507 RepID=A0A2U1TNC6_9GAMM|nr:DUF2732 family protein [Brenneria roseae]PWC10914.1 hypothetical protein B4923_15495 [Brenneria roseae subsp. americana]